MKIKSFIWSELKSLVTLRDSTRKWPIPVLTGISVGIPLLIGLYFQNLGYGLIASLGGLVILYLPESGSLTNKISTVLISSFGFLVSFAVGQFFSFSHISAVIGFGVFSMIIHGVILYYKTAPPRSFFFVFIAAISISQPFEFNEIATKIGLISLGLMLSSSLVLAYLIFLSIRNKKEKQPETQSMLTINVYADFWEAIIMGGFMALSLAVGYLLHLENPYWIPVSSAAVMQGASRSHIWQRTFHRILGTTVGLGLTWGLLSISRSPVTIVVSIIALQMIVETFVVRNYALTVLFITPLAIFLAEADKPIIYNPDLLISLRFQEIIIGSFLGSLGGWLLHKEKIRYATIKGLQKISHGFENKQA